MTVLSNVQKVHGGHGMKGMLILSMLSMLIACAPKGAPHPPEAVPGERKPYVIGVTDVLSIVVWKNPELTVTVPVRPDGAISVPLLDDVQAEGLTPEELKEVITDSLEDFISNPDVTVMISQMNSNTVSMLGGGLPHSGLLPLVREMRVLEAIAQMGGFSPFAKKNRIRILRKANGGLVEYRFNYGAYLAGKAPHSNLVLMSGDTVIVED